MKKFILSLCLFTYLISTGQSQNSPNFIIILTDDQGWASTSTLMDPDNPDSKSDYYVTPNMDTLFDNSTVFSQGYAPGAYCIPSRRSIQTGQSAARITFNTRDKQVRGEEYTTAMSLPRVLKAADPNYVTAHFGKWHLENDYADPGAMGYDLHDGDTTNAEGDPDEPGTPQDQPSLYPFIQKDPKKVFSLTDRTNHFMEEQVNAGKPFFVQLSHYAVHLDIASTQESLDKALATPIGEKHVIPPFKAMMEDMDASIGQLLAKVEELGISDNTYIIFTSDNGFRADIVATGYESYVATQTTNYPLTGAKHAHTEGGIRVPFSISGPGIGKGIYSDVPVSSLDLLPTFAEITGYTGQLNNIDGGSLKDVLENNGTGNVSRPNDFFVLHGEKRSAMIRGEYKLYVDYKEGTIQLFKPAEDASELNDLSGTETEVMNEMKALFDAYLNEVEGVNDASMIGEKVHIDKISDPAQSIPVGDNMYIRHMGTDVYINNSLTPQAMDNLDLTTEAILWDFSEVGTQDIELTITGNSNSTVKVYYIKNATTDEYLKGTAEKVVSFTTNLEDTDDFKFHLEPAGEPDLYYIRRINSKHTFRVKGDGTLILADGVSDTKTGSTWKWYLSTIEEQVNTVEYFESMVQNNLNQQYIIPKDDSSLEYQSENEIIEINASSGLTANWAFEKIKDGIYAIKNTVTSGYLMNENGKVVSSAIKIYMDDYSWELHETGDNNSSQFYIKNIASGSYITFDEISNQIVYQPLKHTNAFKWMLTSDIANDIISLPLEGEGISTNVNDKPKYNNLKVTVYPNPVKTHLTVKSNNDISYSKYQILDLNGKVVSEGTLSNASTIDVQTISDGIYLLKLFSDKRVAMCKFVKE